MFSPLLFVELLEELQVVLEHQTNVVDAVLQHGDALDANAEGETGILVRVNVATLRPLGPRVIFTVFARVSIPAHSALRASSPCLICFAIIKSLLQSSNFNFRGETYSTMARISP